MEFLQSHCIKECANWILSNNFKQVLLEFYSNPQCSTIVKKLLENETGSILNIDMNTAHKTRGNCCVNELKTIGREVEAVIHFGHACLTPTIYLPVLHVLNSRKSFDSSKLLELVLSSADRPKKEEDLILLCDMCFTPFISSFYDILKTHFPNLILSKLVIPEKAKLTFYNDSKNLNFEQLNINEANGKTVMINNRKFILPENKDLKNYNFIYICGECESPAMLSYHMRFSDKVFYVIDHAKLSFTRSTFMKTVMGRSKKIEQVREAKFIGILLNFVDNHEKIKFRMMRLIKFSKKECRSYYLGEINEAKLENHPRIHTWVYIACPESSLFDRLKEKYLYKNIVTPWELEVALNPLYEWSLNFETNFNELLNVEIQEEPEEEAKENVDTETDHNQKREKSNNEIMERKPGTLHKIHENGPGEFLQSLSWKGLDLNEESSVPIGTIVEGRSGIPMMYDNELKYKKT